MFPVFVSAHYVMCSPPISLFQDGEPPLAVTSLDRHPSVDHEPVQAPCRIGLPCSILEGMLAAASLLISSDEGFLSF